MVIKSEMDIIKTIEDDEEVENFSEDSDVEVDVSLMILKNLFLFFPSFFFNFPRIFPNFSLSVSTNETKKTEEGAL